MNTKILFRLLLFIGNPIKRLPYYAFYQKAVYKLSIEPDSGYLRVFILINLILFYNFLNFLYLGTFGHTLSSYSQVLHCDALYLLMNKHILNLFGAVVNLNILFYNWKLFLSPSNKMNTYLAGILLEKRLPEGFTTPQYRKRPI